jgi:DNA-binding transcriptional LysR family regulator
MTSLILRTINSNVAMRVGETRPIVCAGPGYLAAHGTPVIPAELANHACISFDGLTSPRAWTFSAGKSEQTVQIHPRLVTNTAESAIDAARLGVGQAPLPLKLRAFLDFMSPRLKARVSWGAHLRRLTWTAGFTFLSPRRARYSGFGFGG